LKPILAASVKLDQIKYPVYCSPKLDGIRCLIVDGKPVSRSLKPIRNEYIQKQLNNFPPLDGELMLRHKASFQEITSAIMSEDGEPDFVYMVFDMWSSSQGYLDRVRPLVEDEDSINEYLPDGGDRVKILDPDPIYNQEELLKYEAKCLELGFEGVILRSADGLYKFGRSTVNQGWLLKLKRFADSEAEVIGLIEEQHNTNEAKTNALGRTERSHAKGGMIGKGSLGALQVRDVKSGVEFKIGTGFDARDREVFWHGREAMIGKIVKYKYQPVGTDEKPRFPVFLSFRDKEDM
jgi:DNA ligase-1